MIRVKNVRGHRSSKLSKTSVKLNTSLVTLLHVCLSWEKSIVTNA